MFCSNYLTEGVTQDEILTTTYAVNYSYLSLILIIFCMHCPASNSLATFLAAGSVSVITSLLLLGDRKAVRLSFDDKC